MPTADNARRRQLWRAIKKILFPEYHITALSYRLYLYRQGDHRVKIDIESGGNNPPDTLYIGASLMVYWAEPHGTEPIPEEKRQQILQRLVKHLNKRDGRKIVFL